MEHRRFGDAFVFLLTFAVSQRTLAFNFGERKSDGVIGTAHPRGLLLADFPELRRILSIEIRSAEEIFVSKPQGFGEL
jgi:hypothetical protein